MKHIVFLMSSPFMITLLSFQPIQANGDHGDKAKLVSDASVSIQQAIETATAKAPGKVIEAELEAEHDTTVWEVEIVNSENKVLEVHIDAKTGKVIDVEEED